MSLGEVTRTYCVYVGAAAARGSGVCVVADVQCDMIIHNGIFIFRLGILNLYPHVQHARK